MQAAGLNCSWEVLGDLVETRDPETLLEFLLCQSVAR